MLQQIISPLFNQLLNLIATRFNQQQPCFVPSLGKYSSANYLINLTDLPFNLEFSFKNQQLQIKLAPTELLANSSIRGKSRHFIKLLRKQADSDALFFQQKLFIDGDMEAATAFRNCLERLDFNLVDFLTPLDNPLVKSFLQKILLPKHQLAKTPRNPNLELICPAGNPTILHAAIEAGADAVYFGFAKHGNARNFAGLNFSIEEAANSVEYVHQRQRKILAAINAYPQASNLTYVKETIDTAATIGVDAVILADIGMLDYATQKHPQLARHLSVQASASSLDALEFYAREFGIKRVILPRILNFSHIKDICSGAHELGIEVEIFGFGGLCVMAEGRCSLSGYLTGKAPNMHGVCSPADQISYTQTKQNMAIKLNQFTINEFTPTQTACYPTVCKGKFASNGNSEQHIFEQPTSLSLLPSLGTIIECGVSALKIEGRQRSSAYVHQVVSTFRYALDHLDELQANDLNRLNQQLEPLMEGNHATEGAYRDHWN